MSAIRRRVHIDNLGMCDHCGELVFYELGESVRDAGEKVCPECREILGVGSFGCCYEAKGKGGIPLKEFWVNENLKWVLYRPTPGFVINDFEIYS